MQLTENVEKVVKSEICIPLCKPRINSQLPEKWLTARFVCVYICLILLKRSPVPGQSGVQKSRGLAVLVGLAG